MQTANRSDEFLKDEARYQKWRRDRLACRPREVAQILMPVDGLHSVTVAQVAAIKMACGRSNMAIYKCRDTRVDRAAVLAFAAKFGLSRLDHHLCANTDGVSELSVVSDGPKTTYVPYSNRALSWHTDGYYNKKERQINAVILHCAASAARGGVTAVLDPELAYILLRDENPRFITAFEHSKCMTIPANTGTEGEIRPSVSGPVFSYDASGRIHMRYSARKRNIRWRDDAVTTAARAFLSEILNDEDGPAFHHRLQAGEGLLSNNVLHNRSGFSDAPDAHRHLYRARYFDRIEN